MYLVIGIPLAAMLMGAVTLFVAYSNPDPGVTVQEAPLSRTNWSSGREGRGDPPADQRPAEDQPSEDRR